MTGFQATRSAGRLCGRSVATTLARAGLAAIVPCHHAGRSDRRDSGGSRCNSDAIAQPISEPEPNTFTRPHTLANRPAKPDALAKLSAEADEREARAAALGSNPAGRGIAAGHSWFIEICPPLKPS